MIRRRKKAEEMQLGSESFIDTLSNTVGALALLCILAGLDGGNLRWQLFISEERQANTNAVSLFVSDHRAKIFDIDHMDEKLRAMSRAGLLKPGAPPLLPTKDFPFIVKLTVDGEDTHLDISDSPVVAGDSLDDLLANRGSVAEQLQKQKPEDRHIHIHLDPDSFDIYIALRSHFQDLGYNVGWTPIDGPMSLRFGPGKGDGGGGPGIDRTFE